MTTYYTLTTSGYVPADPQPVLVPEGFQDDVRLIEEWKADGERLMARGEHWSVLFSMGMWWADRPWRKRTPTQAGELK